ncbi:uncharacterized protein LOC135224777 [Macrobrachium nipponense]|uniref:uncharacterized protein LOC135224777 n=1 Tax=Macrobrachium nipponense TaxID=159736 RepID=UPI0030C7F0FE
MKRTTPPVSEDTGNLHTQEGSSEGSLSLEELFHESNVSPSADQGEISQEEEEEPVVPEETPSSQSVPEDSSETTVAELAHIESLTLEVQERLKEAEERPKEEQTLEQEKEEENDSNKVHEEEAEFADNRGYSQEENGEVDQENDDSHKNQ